MNNHCPNIWINRLFYRMYDQDLMSKEPWYINLFIPWHFWCWVPLLLSSCIWFESLLSSQCQLFYFSNFITRHFCIKTRTWCISISGMHNMYINKSFWMHVWNKKVRLQWFITNDRKQSQTVMLWWHKSGLAYM